jgi:hypothetical protein
MSPKYLIVALSLSESVNGSKIGCLTVVPGRVFLAMPLLVLPFLLPGPIIVLLSCEHGVDKADKKKRNLSLCCPYSPE